MTELLHEYIKMVDYKLNTVSKLQDTHLEITRLYDASLNLLKEKLQSAFDRQEEINKTIILSYNHLIDVLEAQNIVIKIPSLADQINELTKPKPKGGGWVR